MANVAALIPAAGQGKRMGLAHNKQFINIKGMPAIFHTINTVIRSEAVNQLILICAAGEEEFYHPDHLASYGITKPLRVVTGGKERQDSVYKGLLEIDEACDYVMVHDGARPLIENHLIKEAIGQAVLYKAVVVGVPVKDTIKRTDAQGYIRETPVREGLWQIQTPQIFEKTILVNAYDKAMSEGFYGTDDASLVERTGTPVKMVLGSYENIKITTPEDVVLAEAFLKRRDHC